MEEGVELEEFLNKLVSLVNKKFEKQKIDNAIMEKKLTEALREQNMSLTQQIRTLQEHQTNLLRRISEMEKNSKLLRPDLLKQLEQ